MNVEVTSDLMRRAGEVTRQLSLNDEELDTAILGTTLASAYLEGKGSGYALAITPLRQELEMLKTFKMNRELKRTCFG